MRLASLVALASVAFVACYRDNDPRLPPVEPDYPARGQLPPELLPDGDEARRSPCGQACEHLRAIGCPEGLSSSCYRGCVKQASLERIPVKCWTEASTQDAARACGLLRCKT